MYLPSVFFFVKDIQSQMKFEMILEALHVVSLLIILLTYEGCPS